MATDAEGRPIGEEFAVRRMDRIRSNYSVGPMVSEMSGEPVGPKLSAYASERHQREVERAKRQGSKPPPPPGTVINKEGVPTRIDEGLSSEDPKVRMSTTEVVAAIDQADMLSLRDAGLLKAIFHVGEEKLGLVIDWSMPLPVVRAVLPGGPAARMPSLQPYMVLLRINEKPLVPGVSRQEVEKLLEARPLNLLFEAPDLQLLEQSFEEQHHLSLRKQAKSLQQQTKEPGSPNGGLVSGVQGMGGKSFFDIYPERSPLSRWGKIDRLPAAALDSSQLQALPRISSEPTLLRAGSLGATATSMGGTRRVGTAPLSTMSLASGQSSFLTANRSFTAGHPGFGNAARRAGIGNVGQQQQQGHFPPAPTDMLPPVHPSTSSGKLQLTSGSFNKSRSLTFGATNMPFGPPAPLLDPCYQFFADNNEALMGSGPGPTSKWPLNHEKGFICRLGDMCLVSSIMTAYEAGFKGYKQDRPGEDLLRFFGGRPPDMPPRMKFVDQVFEIWCDLCGTMLADISVPGKQWFYYCRACKKKGHRYELCATCHASEVLQGEGKHPGPAPHPHFSRCGHTSLVRRCDLRYAYAGSPYLRRAFCDLCGHMATRPTEILAPMIASRGVAAAGVKQPVSVYTCTRCPEELGLRFELCEPCAFSVLEKSAMVERTRANGR